MEYTRLPAIPNLLSQYGRAALGAVPVVGGSRDGKSMPATGVEVSGVRVDVANHPGRLRPRLRPAVR